LSRNIDAEEILVQTITGVTDKDATTDSILQPSFAGNEYVNGTIARPFVVAFVRAFIWCIISMMIHFLLTQAGQNAL